MAEGNEDEYLALIERNTWTLLPPLDFTNVVDYKWMYMLKKHAHGSLAHYKARPVAKRFTQKEGLDYFEMFSHVIKQSTIRVILSIALHHGWKLHQLDVSNAFLNGHLSEVIFMNIPLVLIMFVG